MLLKIFVSFVGLNEGRKYELCDHKFKLTQQRSVSPYISARGSLKWFLMIFLDGL